MDFRDLAAKETSAFAARVAASAAEQSKDRLQAFRTAINAATKALETALVATPHNLEDQLGDFVARLTKAASAQAEAAAHHVSEDARKKESALQAKFDAASKEQQARLDALQREKDALTSALAQTQAAQKKAEDARNRAEDAHSKAEEGLRRLEADLAARTQALKHAESSLAAETAAKKQAESALAQEHTLRGAAEAALAHAEGEIPRMRALVESARNECDNLNSQLELAAVERGNFEEQLAAAHARIDALVAADATARADADTARTELDATRAHLDAARAELDSTMADLDTVRAELHNTRAELDTVRSDVDGMRAALDVARADADASRAALDNVRAELNAARSGADAAVASARADLDTTLAAARADAEAALAAEVQARAALEAALTAEAGAKSHARNLEARVVTLEQLSHDLSAQLAAAHATPAPATTATSKFDELLSAFQGLAGAATIGDVLTTTVEYLAGEFPRVALFHVKGNRLEGGHQIGFEFDNDIAKVVVPLGMDSLLTRAASTGMTERIENGEGPAAAPFGGHPGSALAIPIVVNGETTAVIYGEDPGAPDATQAAVSARFAAALCQHATAQLMRRTNELRTMAELRAYAASLLEEIEQMYDADVIAGKSAADLQSGLRGNLDYARSIYANRVQMESPDAAAFLEDRLLELLDERRGTPFGDGLGTLLADSIGLTTRAAEAS
jgi:hypothetical protein